MNENEWNGADSKMAHPPHALARCTTVVCRKFPSDVCITYVTHGYRPTDQQPTDFFLEGDPLTVDSHTESR
jgi:hypothetical protein